MPWFPGQARYYNEFLSNRIPLALGAAAINGPLAEMKTITGLQAAYYDIFTAQVILSPKLDSTPEKESGFNVGVLGVKG